MRALILLAASLWPGGGSAGAGAPGREALMDEVEGKVRLPAGAAPLRAYARHYAYSGRGKVVALYRIAMDPPWPCPVGEEKAILAGVPCERAGLRPERLPKRRWVDALPEPGVFDGGCAVVRFVFDLAARRVERIGCNGVS